MSRPNLAKLCREWSDRLRLRDWDITVAWVRYQDLGMYGCSACFSGMKSASLKIATPESLPQEDISVVQDVEVTLVHELLHVASDQAVMDLGCKGKIVDNGSPIFEAFIEQTAQALVAAKRGLVRLPVGGGDGQ